MHFKFFDVAADGGLREVDGLTGLTEAGQFNNFAEYVKLPKIHRRIKG